jgi:predicted secreted protein
MLKTFLKKNGAEISFVPARLLLVALACGGLLSVGRAQTPAVAHDPAHVVNLSASSFLEVEQDWLSMSLSTTREGNDATAVQNQLKQALDAALAVARPAAQPELLELRTGQFSLYPRYGTNGKINGWRGSAELWLEGHDFGRISSTAGKVQTLTMGEVGFSLSRKAQQRLESDVQGQAIERFKSKAAEVAKGFGFSGYTLREVSVSSADQGGGPVRPRMMAMEAKSSMADAPVPVEAGKSMVSVTVSGSIQLR